LFTDPRIASVVQQRSTLKEAMVVAERIAELRYNLQFVSDGIDGDFRNAFECVSLCSSLVRNTPGPPHKCIDLLDEMTVSEFMDELTPENAWETLLVFAKHLKLCRALQELTQLLVSQVEFSLLSTPHLKY
jgi:hypothetical protein